MSRSTTRRSQPGRAAIVIVTAAVAGTLTTAGTADAGYNVGVKYVDFSNEGITCAPGDALPCPPGVSPGASNTVVVEQALVNGAPRFTPAVGTAPGHAGDVRLGLHLDARCRAGYRIESAAIHSGASSYEGVEQVVESPEVPQPLDSGIDVNGSPSSIDVHIEHLVPVVASMEAVDEGEFVAVDDIPIVPDLADFDPAKFGEAMIEAEVAAGGDEAVARSRSRSMTVFVDLHAVVLCRGTGWLHLRREMHNSARVPIRIVWQPAPAEIVSPGPHRTPPRPDSNSRFTAATWVTQSQLFTMPDPDDPCRLALSGVLVATGPTPVTYRFVDQFGTPSQTFATAIDATRTAYPLHFFEFEPTVADGDLGFAIGGDGGEIDDYAAAPSDSVQGYFQLEVLSPNHLLSAVADYDIPPCRPPLRIVGE